MKYLAVVILLVAAGSACADPVTIYRYRDADGKSHYSDKPIPGGKLIETFRYTMPASASPQPDTSVSDAEGEARIRKHLAALESAWAEVQVSERALTAAEERRAAGATPLAGEVQGLIVEGERRARFRPEYVARQEKLDAEVEAARMRNQRAWERYNQLR